MNSSLHFLQGGRHDILLSNQVKLTVLFPPPATQEVTKIKKWKIEKNGSNTVTNRWISHETESYRENENNSVKK